MERMTDRTNAEALSAAQSPDEIPDVITPGRKITLSLTCQSGQATDDPFAGEDDEWFDDDDFGCRCCQVR